MRLAYKRGDGRKIDGRRVLVDVERGRTVRNWKVSGADWTRRDLSIVGFPLSDVKHYLVGCRRSSVVGRWFLVGRCWLSVVGCRSLIIGGRLLVVGRWSWIVGVRLLVVGRRWSVIGHRLPVVGRWPSIRWSSVVSCPSFAVGHG